MVEATSSSSAPILSAILVAHEYGAHESEIYFEVQLGVN